MVEQKSRQTRIVGIMIVHVHVYATLRCYMKIVKGHMLRTHYHYPYYSCLSTLYYNPYLFLQLYNCFLNL